MTADTCGVKQAAVPWARPDSGFTLLFEALIMALRPYDRQGDLLGPSPDSVLSPDHLARVIDEFVESIAVGRLNERYQHTPGEPAYDVRLLSKVWIYAYARGLTSSRV